MHPVKKLQAFVSTNTCTHSASLKHALNHSNAQIIFRHHCMCLLLSTFHLCTSPNLQFIQEAELRQLKQEVGNMNQAINNSAKLLSVIAQRLEQSQITQKTIPEELI